VKRRIPVRFLLVLGLAGAAAVVAILYFRSGSKSAVPIESITTVPGVTTRPISLYVGDPGRPALVTEGREIVVDSGAEAWMRRVLDELLRGSLAGNRPLLREECRVRSVFLESEDLAVVDFEGTPLRGDASSPTCELALQALLRVIAEEFPKIRRVSLLVRGAPLGEVETRLAVPAVIDLRVWSGARGPAPPGRGRG
jgi:hypothetical protein